MKFITGQGSCGVAAGAGKVHAAVTRAVAEVGLDAATEITGCIGMCYLEPIVDVIFDDGRRATYVRVDENSAREIVKSAAEGRVADAMTIPDAELAVLESQLRIALRNCGHINPENIDEYIKAGGYEALSKVLREMTPESVVDEIKISGLQGRGGAGFPTWFKWDAARKSTGDEKYMVCNADEGDPGAFMDRSIMEGDPHSVIEGMLIGGYAIGASEGIIYVRAEYPLAIKRLKTALGQAKERGFLGKNILGSDFSFDIRIKAGAGAFVCGEETALIASLEGERGMPRLKPPFPAQKGFWRKPTNINNVETFANIAWIISNGGAKYAEIGSEKSKGTKVFALTGKIAKGGLVEVPIGIPLKDIIFGIGGGIRGGKQFKAVQMGGPSGGCIPASLADTPVDYESLAKTGAIMGSGGMVVMDEDACMVDMAKFFLSFTRDESCGKCTHCRIGTKRMLEILERICDGNGRDGDIELLERLGNDIKNGSLCALGQTAPNPVLSNIRYFRDEYEAHIRDKKCPAHQCKALLTYSILADKCTGCGLCARKCPVSAITGERKAAHKIDETLCIKCGKCMESCKFAAISVE